MNEDTASVHSDLDTSWADPDRDEESIELERMTEIWGWILYIDSEGNLQHVYREKLVLDEIDSVSALSSTPVAAAAAPLGSKLARSRLLQFVHSKKQHQGLKYRLLDILLYHVGLGPAQLLTGDGDYATMGKLSTVTIQDEIAVAPSLCIFHEVNCLYFLFQEPPKYDDDPEDDPEDDEEDDEGRGSRASRPLPKPPLNIHRDMHTPPVTLISAFLQREGGLVGRRKKTKKVTFQDMAYRYTRKRNPA